MKFYGPNPPPDTDIVVPRRFKGWYKFVKDSFVLDAGFDICFQRNATLPVACGKGYAYLYPMPASVWTPFSLELDTPTSPAGIAAPVNGYSISVDFSTKDTSAYPVSYLQLDGLRVEYDTVSTNGIVTPPARAQMSISPNPAAKYSKLDWQEPLPEGGVVLVQNVSGQTVRRLAVNKGERSLEFDCSFLPQGVYVVRVVAPGHAPPPVRLAIQ